MIKTIIKQSFLWLLIVGSLGYAIAYILGTPTPTFIVPRTVNGQTIYSFNLLAYIQTVQASLNFPFKDMISNTPKWPAFGIESATIVIPIINGNIFIINWVIYLLNVIVLMPTKFLLQPVVLILAVLGINVEQIGILNAVNQVYSLEIPFVPYIHVG